MRILNLPSAFPVAELDQFNFGSLDAVQDDLLLKPYGFCDIRAVREVLKDQASIIYGPRGAGKSAIFRMLLEERIAFKRSSRNQLVVAIDSSNDYQALRHFLLERIGSVLADPALKARVAWEIFLLYRIHKALEKAFPELPREVVHGRRMLEQIFDLTMPALSLADFLRSIKVTAGIRLDSSQPLPVPDAYVSSEPADATLTFAEQAAKTETAIGIDKQKRVIDGFLKEKGTCLYILVDELDQFVTRDEYETQKIMVLGLLECEKGYAAHRSLRLKVFLRDDLLRRLDLGRLGWDKVFDRAVKLEWRPEDIRRFMSQRLLSNYRTVIGREELVLENKGNFLMVDEFSASLIATDDVEGAASSLEILRRRLSEIWDAMTEVWRRFVAFFETDRTDEESVAEDLAGESEHVNLTDEVNRSVIWSIFPRAISVQTGGQDTLDFLKFLEEYISLADGKTTPRIALSFLKLCFQEAEEFYRENPDRVVEQNEKGEYNLINRDMVVRSYEALKSRIWTSFKIDEENWASWFGRLQEYGGKKRSLRFSDIKDVTKARGDLEELGRFIAFLNQVGLLRCENPNVPWRERRYEFPRLFR